MRNVWSLSRLLRLVPVVLLGILVVGLPAAAGNRGSDSRENSLDSQRQRHQRRAPHGQQLVVRTGVLGMDNAGRLTLDDEFVLTEDEHTRWLEENRPDRMATPSQGRSVRILGLAAGQTLMVRVGYLRDPIRASSEVMGVRELVPTQPAPPGAPQ